MIKCEKNKSGFVVEIDGQFNDVISEMAYAVASLHVRTMEKELGVNMNDEKDCAAAVEAASTAFSLIMEEAMYRILGMEKEPSLLKKVASLFEKKKKAGDLQ